MEKTPSKIERSHFSQIENSSWDKSEYGILPSHAMVVRQIHQSNWLILTQSRLAAKHYFFIFMKNGNNNSFELIRSIQPSVENKNAQNSKMEPTEQISYYHANEKHLKAPLTKHHYNEISRLILAPRGSPLPQLCGHMKRPKLPRNIW